MTDRTQIAMHALAGLLANPRLWGERTPNNNVRDAVYYADALLEQLARIPAPAGVAPTGKEPFPPEETGGAGDLP